MDKVTILLIAASLAISGCSQRGIEGDGNIITENRTVSEYSAIKAIGGCQIKWATGMPALSITTDSNLLSHIKTEVHGRTLKILSPGILRPTQRITVVLSSASLADVRLTGGMSFTASPLSGTDLKLETTGASDVCFEGAVTNLDVRMTGASKLDAKALKAQTATLSLVGASAADITVAEALSISMTGACSLTYSGNPKTVDKSATGACSIRQRP